MQILQESCLEGQDQIDTENMLLPYTKLIGLPSYVLRELEVRANFEWSWSAVWSEVGPRAESVGSKLDRGSKLMNFKSIQCVMPGNRHGCSKYYAHCNQIWPHQICINCQKCNLQHKVWAQGWVQLLNQTKQLLPQATSDYTLLWCIYIHNKSLYNHKLPCMSNRQYAIGAWNYICCIHTSKSEGSTNQSISLCLFQIHRKIAKNCYLLYL